MAPIRAVFFYMTLPLIAPPSVFAALPEEAAGYHRDFQSEDEGISIGEIEGGAAPVYDSAGKLRKDGPEVDPDTLFEIGSITKVFTGILLADAFLKKKAAPEDPVSKYLPEDLLATDSPLHSVTLLDLATHTSGLPRLPSNMEPGANPLDPYAHYSVERLHDYLKEFRESDLEKRGETSYSNLGMGLLGYLLERIGGKPYEELVTETIFVPLGMSSSFVRRKADSVPAAFTDRLATGHSGGIPVAPWHIDILCGAGAITSSIRDLASFAEGHWSEKTPASLRAAMELAAKPQRGDVGLGWFIGKDGLSHDGGTGGFRSELRISPETKTATIRLMNGTGPAAGSESEGDFTSLAGYWEGTLAAGTVKLRQVFRISESGRVVLHSLDQGGVGIPANKTRHEAGTFHAVFGGAGGAFEAKVEGDSLVGTWKQGGERPLILTRANAAPPALVASLAQRADGDLSELKGYWSGYLGGKAGLFVILEIDAFDGTGEARLYSPDQTPEPFPVSSLSFDGTQLTLTITSVQATFTAERGDDGKLSGAWKQGPLPLPLTLTKSDKRPERE